MAADNPIADGMLDTALGLIAASGWRTLTMAEIAEAAGVSLAEVYRSFPTKAHLLAELVARTDLAVLAGPPADPSEAPRDRLFDVLMRRFDALQPHRDAYLRLMRELPLDPPAMLVFLPRLALTMSWMIEAAGLSATGPAGWLRWQGLAVLYLDALRAWARDDSPDLARTMARLDRGLARADALARRLPGWGPPPAPAAMAASAGASSIGAAADPSHDDRVPD